MGKINIKHFLIAFFLFVSGTTFAQNIRGFYITDIGSWLGNTTKENEILVYAQGNGFNYINFYDLGSVNWSSTSDKNKLASFMSRARSQYGLTEFGAVVETYAYAINNIIPYNNSRTVAGEKFDIINLEFEFWVNSSISSSYCSKFLSPNGYSCDTAGAWRFCWKQFKLIDSLCASNGLISEVYLGWPNQGQMQQLASIADRILLHAYRPTDGDVYAYSKNRLKDIGNLGGMKKVIPLFSSEPAFMGSWLNSHPVGRPYQTYAGDLAAETQAFKNNIDLQGYHWFTYQHMPQTISATATISASGPLTFCSGGSVILTANSGAAYLWSPGGYTTRSITVSTPGSYTVQVTNSSGVVVTSAPAVVAYTTVGGTPIISASGPVSFCPGGSVTLSASQSASYAWSTGATTQSITVSTSGSYTVTTGGGSCSGTSAPTVVNASATPTVPTITASGPLNMCAGTQLTLTSTVASGYLWSNGATTRSIVVSAAGSYSVNAYNGPACSAPSAVSSVAVKPLPATPSITPNGSVTLSTAQPSVKLTSSAAAAYQWSTGAVTRSINVTTQGTYRVTITGANGCTKISNPIPVKANGCAPPAVPVISLSGSNILSAGQTVTLSSTNAGGYLWSTGATTQSITVSAAGNYTVRAYSAGSCFSTSLPVSIVVLSPINDGTVTEFPGVAKLDQGVNGDAEFSTTFYPNPVRTELNVAFTLEKESKMNLRLIDVTGREIQRRDIAAIKGDNLFQMNVSELPKGIYFACLMNEEHKQVVKVVVE